MNVPPGTPVLRTFKGPLNQRYSPSNPPSRKRPPGYITPLDGSNMSAIPFVPREKRAVSMRSEAGDLPPEMTDVISQKYTRKSSVIRIDATKGSDPGQNFTRISPPISEPARSRDEYMTHPAALHQSRAVSSLSNDGTLPFEQRRATPPNAHKSEADPPPRVTFAPDLKTNDRNPLKTQKSRLGTPTEFCDQAEKNKCFYRLNRGCLWRLILLLISLLFVLSCAFVYYAVNRNRVDDFVTISPVPSTPLFNTTHSFTRNTRMPKQSRICVEPGCVKAAAYIEANMDPKINPCQDFYSYACGGWVDRNYISPGMDEHGVVSELTERNDRVLSELFRRGAQFIARDFFRNEPKFSDAEIKASDFYLSCIDLAEIEALGKQPLVNLIKSLGGWGALNMSSRFNLNEQLYQNHGVLSNNVLFSINVKISPFDNKTSYIFMIDQLGSLTLPDPSFYWLNIDPMVSPDIEQAMKQSITTILKLLKAQNIDYLVDNIYDFEKNLSKIHIPSHNQRYLEKITLQEMRRLCPEINWIQLFRRIAAGVSLNGRTEVVIKLGMREYLKNLSSLIQRTDKKTLENYFMWRIAFTRSLQLSSRFRRARLDLLYDINGIVGSPDRLQDCLRFTKLQFNEAVQVMFAREKFKWGNKAKIEGIAKSIKVALQNNLDSLDWIEPSTRLSAKKKLATLKISIGFERKYLEDNKWLDQLYGFSVNRKTFFDNYEKSIAQKVKTTARQLLVPVNTEKVFPPFQADNSVYYSRADNKIVLGFGYLQPPYYNEDMPSAINFGAVGSTIGHELIHAFEYHGDKYDLNWGRDATNYQQLVSCVTDKYGRYGVSGVTVYENLADMAGVKLAYQAFKSGRNGIPSEKLPVLQGMSHEKAFFLSFAQTFCTKQSSTAYVNKINYGLHAPQRYRVLGSLSQFPKFAEVFSCALGSEMNPKQQCRVW